MSLLLALTGGGGGTSHTLTLDAGAYALAGQDAAFSVSRTLALDAGSYALAGQDAGFQLAKVMALDAGAYVIAGQELSFAQPVVTPPPAYSGGSLFDSGRGRKRKREDWQDELARMFARPVVDVEPVADVAPPRAKSKPKASPKLSEADRAYVDGTLAAIINAKNGQELARKAIEAARVQRDREAAELLMTQAVEAERVAQQEMIDFDIAFVVAALIEA